MTRFLVPLLAVALFASAAGSAPKVKDKVPPAPPIVGEWVAESRTIGGRVIAQPAVHTRLVFRADGTYTFVVNGQDPDPDGHKFKVNPKTDPAEIDFEPREKPAYLGVFKIEKETLTLCINPAGDPRPTTFESAAGSKTTLYVFRRASKE
jgi:uncharacterized protein (TIGR03067 family)